MKKLGLVGGVGPESTIPYYHDIVYGVQAKLGRHAFPLLTVESVDVYHSLQLMGEQRFEEYIAYFSQALENLAHAGADFAAISANTPHQFFAELQERSPLPLVSIVEAAAEEAVRRGYRRLGLLGTRFTMQADFFQQAFAAHGLELATPTAAEISFIGDKIEEELEQGVKNPATLAAFQEIIARLQQEESIEAVILGCTELPLLLNDAVSPVPCLDTMQVHIQKLIAMILEEE